MRDARRDGLVRVGLGIAVTAMLLGTAALAQPSAAATGHAATTTKVTKVPRKVAAKAVAGGVVSFTFDDGKIDQYRNARPALIAAHLHGTYYIISDGLGWGTKTNMSPTEARQLVKEGNEIGNHTRDHADLASLSDSQVQAEFADSQAVIRAKVGVTPTTCAYPFGSSNASVEAIAAQKHLKACRGTSSGTNTGGHLAAYNLLVKYVHTDTTATDIRKAANAARVAKTWLILVYHGVGTVGSVDDVTAAQFRSHVQAVKYSGIAVKTVAQELTALGR
jgi:peptidoglycan/xylan/chitin deacetylase (PgdA/CDA1 family)